MKYRSQILDFMRQKLAFSISKLSGSQDSIYVSEKTLDPKKWRVWKYHVAENSWVPLGNPNLIQSDQAYRNFCKKSGFKLYLFCPRF